MVPAKNLKEKSEGWVALVVVVVRSLGRQVSVETMARDFRSKAGLKGEVVRFNMENGFVMFCFKEAREKDLAFHLPWVVASQARTMEPGRPEFFPSKGAIHSAHV